MAKEKHQLYMQGFTEEEFEDLHNSSTEHTQKLKKGMKNHVHAIVYEGTPGDIFNKLARDAYDYLRENAICCRPQFKSDVINAMRDHPNALPSWHDFLVEKLVK